MEMRNRNRATNIEPENYALYRNIKKSYEQNIKTADFDTLIDEVDRHMSTPLCAALKTANSYVESLRKTKFVIPALTNTVDRIIRNVTRASDNAVRRYKFFTENWTELIEDLSAVPQSLHSFLLPMILERSSQSAFSFTRLIVNEVESIQGAVLIGSSEVSQIYIWNIWFFICLYAK